MTSPTRYRKRCEQCRHVVRTFGRSKRDCPRCGGWLVKAVYKHPERVCGIYAGKK